MERMVMGKAEILEKLSKAVIEFNKDAALAAAKEAYEAGLDPIEAIEKGLTPGIREVGDRFARYEYPLPYVILAAEAMQAAIDYLLPKIPKEKKPKPLGKIVIGTAYGDIHSIGKNLVRTMLNVSGFECYDLGEEVPTENFINKAEEVKADIIAVGALMTSSMSYQKALIDTLVERGLRDKYKVLVGGTPMTEDFCRAIKADDWGADAGDAVRKAKKLVGAT
jgi:corrinoid protein of di/trimethylamine methyltransferase